MTTKNQTEDLLEGFKSGGNDYLKEDHDVQIITTKGIGYHFSIG